MNSHGAKYKISKSLGILIFCLPLTTKAMLGCGVPPQTLRPFPGNGFQISSLPVTAAVWIVPNLTPIRAQLPAIGSVPGPGLGPVVWPQPAPHLNLFGKPGWCPAPGNIFGGCRKCDNDYNCPGKQKCCSASSLKPCCTAVK